MVKNLGINTIKDIFDSFEHKSEYKVAKELTSGHINDTYLIETEGDDDFILQRINHNIFKDVPSLVNNKVIVSKHIKSKLSHLSEEEINKKTLQFVKAKNSNNYHLNKGVNYWNTMIYIKNSYTHEIVKSEKIAYEGGKLLGEFLNLTADLDSNKLSEVIPKFHDMSFRFQQYNDSLKKASKERLDNAKSLIDEVAKLHDDMLIIQNLKKDKKIPLRLTHNDTKISNTLFDGNDNGLCIIDTDTVMPGIVHYDYGDALRTICNTAAEDEKDLSKVSFNFDFYKNYTRGFMDKMHDVLTPIEKKYLPLSIKTMIFIMALRFLTDYLNDDIYYKTKYPEHNLVRAKNQFKLIASLDNVYEKMDV